MKLWPKEYRIYIKREHFERAAQWCREMCEYDTYYYECLLDTMRVPFWFRNATNAVEFKMLFDN